MSDFEKLINASDLIEWVMETNPDGCVGAARSIVDHVEDMPSVQPEPDWDYSEETKQITLIVPEDVYNSAETIFLSVGYEGTFGIRGMVYSAQPERQRGGWIEYIPEHGKCPFCGNQIDLLNGKANNFCGECGADMRGKQND